MLSIIKRLIYYYYEKRLKSDVLKKQAPAHVGIILDGNRRYAEKQKFASVSQGHKKGANKIDEVILWCIELKIKVVTIWGFSTDNFKREKDEVESILNIIKSKLEYYIDSEFINNNRIRVSIIGKKELLPDNIKSAIERLEEKTASYENFHLYIALGYGGRQEICDAFSKLVIDNLCNIVDIVENKNNRDSYNHQIIDYNQLSDLITVEDISKYLYTKESTDPDLIIRTSGEVRLSGFLLWQSAYSEYYFCDAYWPEFRKIDFLRAIRSYQSRQIRLGK
jgi:short-chain Z-isoprenyl diphosphate synthase